MGKLSVIPFGPQHPVLPEPIHLDLVLEDETVVKAIPSIGYIHRGLEKLVQKKNYKEYVYIAERICGICSFGHGMGYCETIENIMDIEVPDRAKYLRTIWSELSRLHSHLLWLGLQADAFGFESLFMQAWRMREKILDRRINSRKHSTADCKKMTDTFLNDYSVNTRLRGVGVLKKLDAIKLGANGPMMRASGVKMDARKLGYEAYGNVDFDIIISEECDSYARTEVRIKEIFQSISIIKQLIDKIPEASGVLFNPPKGNPKGECFVRIEQPRGEAIYYTRANGTQFLDRMRVRTPTFANLPALVETLKGAQLADVPILVLTIDPCISCTER